MRSFAGVAPPDRDPAGADSRTSLATTGLRSSTDALRGVVTVGVDGEGKLGADDSGPALAGVPTSVDAGLWKDGDSMITDWNGWNGGPSARPGRDEDATTPGAGKDGESTTIPGICIGRFSANF